MSNSTHETHTACIERIRKEGASSTCCYCNPHEGCTLGMKPTQNDWEDRWEKADVSMEHVHEGSGCYHRWTILSPQKVKAFIAKELADARKEVMMEVRDTVSKLKIITPEREPPKNKLTQNQIFASGQMNMLVRLNDVLATLKEEGCK